MGAEIVALQRIKGLLHGRAVPSQEVHILNPVPARSLPQPGCEACQQGAERLAGKTRVVAVQIFGAVPDTRLPGAFVPCRLFRQFLVYCRQVSLLSAFDMHAHAPRLRDVALTVASDVAQFVEANFLIGQDLPEEGTIGFARTFPTGHVKPIVVVHAAKIRHPPDDERRQVGIDQQEHILVVLHAAVHQVNVVSHRPTPGDFVLDFQGHQVVGMRAVQEKQLLVKSARPMQAPSRARADCSASIRFSAKCSGTFGLFCSMMRNSRHAAPRYGE